MHKKCLLIRKTEAIAELSSSHGEWFESLWIEIFFLSTNRKMFVMCNAMKNSRVPLSYLLVSFCRLQSSWKKSN